jgi:uncharacterized protein (TIGR02246 family)
MTNFFMPFVMTLFLGLSSLLSHADPAADVKASYATWDQAFNKGDAKALAALYAEDALFLPATHDVITGRSDIEKFFASLFGMGVKGHKLELIQASGNDEMMFGAAKWSAAGKDKAGKDQPWGGVATHIFERQADGSLKLRVHTFN